MIWALEIGALYLAAVAWSYWPEDHSDARLAGALAVLCGLAGVAI